MSDFLTDATFIAQISVKASAGVCLAALGEIVTEKSGVLNLGVEGMMIAGALAAFVTGLSTGSPLAAACAAMAAGVLLALVHAFFCVTLRANQVLSGLAVTILGLGLTSFLGRAYIGKSALRVGVVKIPTLADLPLVGKAVFTQNAWVYAALLVAPLLWWWLTRTDAGLRLRACGEGAAPADAVGVNVALRRYLATAFGGAMAGLGGSYLSLCYTPGWKENMTGGQGWIAVGMVIFAAWNPLLALAGSFLFGFLTALQFAMQASGVEVVPIWLLRAAPYLLTIAVLTLVNASPKLRRRAGAPQDLGRPFLREG